MNKFTLQKKMEKIRKSLERTTEMDLKKEDKIIVITDSKAGQLKGAMTAEEKRNVLMDGQPGRTTTEAVNKLASSIS